jgi:hypothetical protein
MVGLCWFIIKKYEGHPKPKMTIYNDLAFVKVNLPDGSLKDMCKADEINCFLWYTEWCG